MNDYEVPPVIIDTDTVVQVIRGLGSSPSIDEQRLRDLSGLHPYTVGTACKHLLRVIEYASGGDVSRIHDAIRQVHDRLTMIEAQLAHARELKL